MLLGIAYRGEGDEHSARDEIEAAKATFERLGAALDRQRAAELLGEAGTGNTFVFTDIVDSTKLLEALGEEKWQKLLKWHDQLLRERIEEAGGEVIKQTGDGYFAAFGSPLGAVDAAIAIQRALDDEPIAPDVRIGVHSGKAFHTEDDDYTGQGVHVAARIGGAGRRGRDPREHREPGRRESLPAFRAALGDPEGLRRAGRARRRRVALSSR